MASADLTTQVMLGLTEEVLLNPLKCRTLGKVNMILPLLRTRSPFFFIASAMVSEEVSTDVFQR